MIKKAVIPVAGLGTRFLPATIAQPKEMLPIIDKPTIQFVVEEAVKAGFDDITMITGRNKRSIEDHFDPSQELVSILNQSEKTLLLRQIEAITSLGNFFFVRQKQQLGLGHAILQAEKHIGNENFAVLLGDTVIDQAKPCIGEMSKLFSKYNCPVIAVVEVDIAQTSNFGIVGVSRQLSDSVYEIAKIVEKPSPAQSPSNLAVAARYILPPDIFAILKKIKPGKNNEIQLTDAIAKYLQKNKVIAYKIQGERWDIGSKLEYAKAFIKLGLKHPEIKDKLKEFLNSL